MKKLKKSFFLPCLLVFICFLLAAPSSLKGQGHIELGFHYGSWSVNLLKGIIEEGLSEALESELKDQFIEDIQQDHPSLQETFYSQAVEFDSGGNNFGFELRWYPGGKTGSFSLGLSVEKSSFELSLPNISAELDMKDMITQEEASFKGDASSSFLIKPWSFLLSLRWDIIPSSSVHPYFTMGFGAATGTALENATLTYSYSGSLEVTGEEPENYQGGESKSLQQLKEDMEEEGEEFFLPGFIPFIQLNFGLKARVMPNLHLLVDAGVFNGFLLRGGISLRL